MLTDHVIYERELFILCHHFVKFGGHKYYGNSNVLTL